MNLQTILGWLINLKIIPQGWLTKSSAWLGIVAAILTALGHPVPGWLTMLSVGGIGVGLGRRGTQ